MRTVILAVAYVSAYVALDWVSYIHPFGPIAVTAWNPPPGLSVALLLLLGLRFAPLLFVAGIAAELLVRGWPAQPAAAIVATLVLALGYTATVAFLERRVRIDPGLGSVRDMALFTATIGVATLLVAIGYVATFAAGGGVPWAEFPRAVFQFWIGDSIGILVTTPLLVQGAAWRRVQVTASEMAELAAQAAGVIATLWIVFGVGGANAAKFFYLLFLPLIWVSVRYGVRGASLALVAIQLGIVAAVQIRGYGGATLLELQLLMATLALTGLFLGAVVTDRRRTQEDLARSLRLAAAAETASSLAHELNQPLSAIGTYVRACRMMLDDPSGNRARLAETMATVVAEVARAGDVVRRLRDFFRSGSSEFQRVFLPDLIETSVESLRSRLVRHGIVLELQLAPGLPHVLVDPLQIGAVLHNLIGNAVDAMAAAESVERRIIVKADAVRGGVRVTVVDSGPGLSEERADDPFRPFATSKAQGMGIGLAISRSFVENHGGRLVAERRERGAAFSFVLPDEGAQESAA